MKTFYTLLALVVVILLGWYVWKSNNPSSAPSTSSVTGNQMTTTASTTTNVAANSSTSPSSATGTPQTVRVEISNFAFSPDVITIHKGDTVIWKNEDSVPHTVISDTEQFASSNISQSQTYSHTFNQTGTFVYHCSIHSMMKHATIIVE